MAKIDIYNQEGKKLKQITVPAEIFEVEPKEHLLHKAVRIFLANRRHPIAHTKTRSERRGGGAKPWKQKGTGRARAGSRRSPIWKKGGVTFGPRSDRNFSLKMNKKEKKKALFMGLTAKVQDKSFVVLDNLEFKKPQTRDAVKTLENLKIADKKALIVTGDKDENTIKSFKNIPNTKVTQATNLNVYDVLNASVCVMPEDAVKVLENHFLSASTDDKKVAAKK